MPRPSKRRRVRSAGDSAAEVLLQQRGQARAARILGEDASRGIQQETRREGGHVVTRREGCLPSRQVRDVLPSGVVFLDAVAPSCTALIDGNRQDLEADSPDFWRGWSLRHASRPDVEVDGDLLQIPRIAVAFFRVNRDLLAFLGLDRDVAAHILQPADPIGWQRVAAGGFFGDSGARVRREREEKKRAEASSGGGIGRKIVWLSR